MNMSSLTKPNTKKKSKRIKSKKEYEVYSNRDTRFKTRFYLFVCITSRRRRHHHHHQEHYQRRYHHHHDHIHMAISRREFLHYTKAKWLYMSGLAFYRVMLRLFSKCYVGVGIEVIFTAKCKPSYQDKRKKKYKIQIKKKKKTNFTSNKIVYISAPIDLNNLNKKIVYP